MHAKSKLIIYFFLETSNFKESCKLIDQEYFGPQLKNQNFSIYGAGGGGISITELDFILDYFQEKLHFAAILSPFCPNLDKNEFFWKKGLCQVLNIPIIYHHAKNQKKIKTYFWEICEIEGKPDRQWWPYRTVHRTEV